MAALAQSTRDTTMVGRTWMQHALPITFGLKAAGWLDALLRHQDRLVALRQRVLVAQFGGAAGTLASLGEKGMGWRPVASRLEVWGCRTCPGIGQRDRVVEVATVLGLLVGTLGKMARDISLLMQTEVGGSG